jgi:hypothetical protein
MLRAHGILMTGKDLVSARNGPRAPSPELLNRELTDLANQYKAALRSSEADYTEHALIGESMRVFVRDTLLSRTDSRDATIFWLSNSVQAFEAALGKIDEHTPRDHVAWIYAHAGAASATLFWLKQTIRAADKGAHFAKSEEYFTKSLAANPRDWTYRFFGLLHAIRAAPGDFKRAETLLDAVKSADPLEQSSIQRSKALLLGYTALDVENAKIPVEDRLAAARRSISEGFAAGQKDTLDHQAAYAVALSAYSLFKLAESGRSTASELRRLKGQVALARDEAWTRAHNVFSQVCAELASLSLMAAEFDGLSPDEAVTRANRYVSYVGDDAALDLEATLVFDRDPLLKRLRQQGSREANKLLELTERA